MEVNLAEYRFMACNPTPNPGTELRPIDKCGLFLLGMTVGVPVSMLALLFYGSRPNFSLHSWSMVVASILFSLLFIFRIQGSTSKAIFLCGFLLGAFVFVFGLYWIVSSMMPSSIPG